MATQRDRYHEGLGRADRRLFYVYYIVFKQFLSFAAGEDGVPPMVRMGIGPCRQVAHRDAQHRGDVGERRVGGGGLLLIEHSVGGGAERSDTSRVGQEGVRKGSVWSWGF